QETSVWAWRNIPCFVTYLLLLSYFVRIQTGNLTPPGALLEQRHKIFHQGKLRNAAGFPVEAEGLHELGELFTVEDHALQDRVDEGLEAVGGEVVFLCQGGDLGGLAFFAEAFEAGADLVLGAALHLAERVDVVDDELAVVHEPRLAADEADEFVALELELLRALIRVAR